MSKHLKRFFFFFGVDFFFQDVVSKLRTRPLHFFLQHLLDIHVWKFQAGICDKKKKIYIHYCLIIQWKFKSLFFFFFTNTRVYEKSENEKDAVSLGVVSKSKSLFSKRIGNGEKKLNDRQIEQQQQQRLVAFRTGVIVGGELVFGEWRVPLIIRVNTAATLLRERTWRERLGALRCTWCGVGYPFPTVHK